MTGRQVFYENLGLVNRQLASRYKRAFKEILESGWYILGTSVQAFEQEFSRYLGTSYCIGVGNGLDALTLALAAFDFPIGSEVIVPANTYIATILSIIRCNLHPVLVEPDITTYNMDPMLLERAISKRTVAVLSVHLYGKVCDMDPILRISKRYKLALLEDCAQAHGSKYKGKMAGTFGDYGCFSFYPTKNLGALGDAGAIATSKEKLAQKIKLLRNYGSVEKHYNDIVGYNSRLDELQSKFLLAKLEKLGKINAHKRKLAAIYLSNLKSEYVLPKIDKDYYDTYHIFAVRHPARDKVREYLLNKGIKTEIHYPIPPYRQKALGGMFKSKKFPISDEIHKTILSLPISYAHTTDDIYYVVEQLNKYK